MGVPSFWRRTLRGFEPASREAEAAMSRVKLGDVVQMSIRRRRSLQWHRLYWGGLVTLIAENSSYSADEVHALLRLRTGLVSEIRERDGTVWRVPDSIAFDRMSADAWEDYWRRVERYVLDELLPVTPSDLHEALLQRIGMQPADLRSETAA